MNKKRKNNFRKYYQLFAFYISMTAIITTAFLVTGKGVSAYSYPSDAVFYTKQNTFSSVFTQSTTLRTAEEDEIETLTRELRLNFEETLSNSNEENYYDLISAFLPIGLANEGTITSHFGGRSDPFSGEETVHKGTDIYLPEGTPVFANANGVVTSARYSDSYGYVVEIAHIQGYSTVYAHNSQLQVDVGEYVLKGDTIALSGNTGNSTGPHLHYEVRLENEAIAPIWDEQQLYLAED